VHESGPIVRDPFVRTPLPPATVAAADACLRSAGIQAKLTASEATYTRATDSAPPATIKEAAAWSRKRLEREARGLCIADAAMQSLFDRYIRLSAVFIEQRKDFLRVVNALAAAHAASLSLRQTVSRPCIAGIRRQGSPMHTIMARHGNLRRQVLAKSVRRATAQGLGTAEHDTLAAIAEDLPGTPEGWEEGLLQAYARGRPLPAFVTAPPAPTTVD